MLGLRSTCIKTMRFPVVLYVFLVVAAAAQTPYDTSIRPSSAAHEIPANQGSAALWQSLKKLQTRASILMITAHPDDEDGGTLTYESRGKGVRVALLTLNRGEGGANVMSPDYFDGLGIVRTQELLAAGRYYGVDQYWTRLIDYGFSKTMVESMEHWTKDRALYDVVRVVRMVRPLVITSVFVGGPSDGHGNHQAAGALAQEVFKAAGDPNMFPDQIRAGLRPWSPLKDYARVPFSRREGLVASVEVPQGTYDPVLGASYAQISREGLGFQKSQNGGPNIPMAGPINTGYHRYGSRISAQEKEQDFFEGIDISLTGLAKAVDPEFLVAGLRKIRVAVEDAVGKFSANAPERCAPALAAGMRETLALIDAVEKSSLDAESKYDLLYELKIKQAQFNAALVEALALSIAARTEPALAVAIPGQSLGVSVRVVNQGPSAAKLVRLNVESATGPSWTATPRVAAEGMELSGNKPVDAKFTVAVPANAALTRPYFSRPDIEQSFYDVPDNRDLNQPLAPYPLAAWADVNFEGVTIRLGQVVQSAKLVNGLGTLLEPLLAGPAIGISISPRAGIVPLSAKSFEVTTVVHSNVRGPAHGAVRLTLPSGWKSEPKSAQFETTLEGEDRTVKFTVTPENLQEKPYTITAVADYGGREYREGYHMTGYPGLRSYPLYTSSTYKTSGVDVKVATGLKIGYIKGSGDEVPASLEHLGIKVDFLTAEGDLAKYDAILLGVRAYAARPELAADNQRLLNYVKNGGVVMVQYNTPEFDHNFGPYPYIMTSNPEEVTDEASKVQILAPRNPVFTWPNRITEKDFEGWVEERGSKWMHSWDPHYEALLDTHDAGQEPQKGGLLYAKYGKGVYIYNAYAFYRQLPEGVPGAYRIFANMISLPKNPER